MSTFTKLQKELSAEGVTVVPVAVDEPAKASDFLTKKNLEAWVRSRGRSGTSGTCAMEQVLRPTRRRARAPNPVRSDSGVRRGIYQDITAERRARRARRAAKQRQPYGSSSRAGGECLRLCLARSCPRRSPAEPRRLPCFLAGPPRGARCTVWIRLAYPPALRLEPVRGRCRRRRSGTGSPRSTEGCAPPESRRWGRRQGEAAI